MNLALHDIEDFQIAREDTLRNPAFSDVSTPLLKIENVLALSRAFNFATLAVYNAVSK